MEGADVVNPVINNTKLQKAEGEARVKMIPVIEAEFEKLKENLEELADEILLDAGFDKNLLDDDPSQEDMDRWFGLQERLVKAAVDHWLTGEVSPVCVYLGYDPVHGTHVELFSKRPRTQSHGDPSDPENWGKWYRVWEGNIDGGDSVLVDSLGKELMGG